MKLISETETTVIAEHDGRIFLFGKGAGPTEVIGSYVDDLGKVQRVIHGSLYAAHYFDMMKFNLEHKEFPR